MEEEIMNTVESLFGKNVTIVDCQTSSSVQQEEVLLINGIPVKLDGIPNDDANAIKSALLDGQMPAVKHLNQLLFRAGLAQQPIEVETSLTVKSSLTTTEEVLVSRNGHVLDEQTIETKEHFNHQSQQKEIWQPIKTTKTSNAIRDKPCNKIKAIKLKDRSSSTVDSTTETDRETCDENSFSTTHGLNHTWSNATTSASVMSSSSAISGSDRALGSNSNASTATTLGDYSAKCSNLSSCDSGHDGIFHSASLTVNCDLTSSADEAEKLSTQTMNATLLNTPVTDLKLLQATGSLSSLVDLLLPAKELNENICFALIVCVRLFQEPHQFLNKLARKSDQSLSPISARTIVRLLNQWLETCPNDYRNSNFIQELKCITDKCLEYNQQLSSDVSKLLADIPEKLKQHDLHSKESEKFLLTECSSTSSNPPLSRQSSIKSLKRFTGGASKAHNISNIAGSAKELAYQLTSIEHYYLALICPEEFIDMLSIEELQSSILENTKSQTSYNNVSKSNIWCYTQWFNRLSYLVATEVVKLNKKSQSRTQLIDFFVETAMECFNIGNFNSLMAILTGLNLCALTRLKKTWSKVQLTKFSGLEHQMDPTSNFSSYRSTMKAAIWRSERESANEQERAIIPFFTLFLKDLYILNESAPTQLSQSKLNFEKCIQLANHLQSFIKCRRANCPYQRNEKVVSYLQSAQVFSEAELLLASFMCESPDSSEEKEHYKSLKADIKLPKAELS